MRIAAVVLGALVPSLAFAPLAASMRTQDAAGLKEWTRALRDRYPDKRRQAVRKLAELDVRAAWLAIVPALADGEPEVADEAQLRLAAAADAKVVDALRGREGLGHPSVLVRRRVAELLGRRTAATSADWLFEAARDKEPEVRRLALWSIERQAEAGTLRVDDERKDRAALVAIAQKDKDGGVRGAALFALGAWSPPPPELASVVATCARDRAPEVRCAAASVLARTAGRDALRVLAELAADESLAVRRASAAASFARGDRDGARILVDRLGAESTTRLRYRLSEWLGTLAGQTPRLDPRPFRDWVERLPEDWKFEAATEAKRAEAPDTVASWYGLPILSDAFAVLIDMSGSMWTPKDGVVPKTLVEAELGRLLERLVPPVRFNLVPYATTVERLWPRIEPATPRNVQAAGTWFAANGLRGRGNVWDAIELALSDPDTDTLVVFTDGAPTGGPHWNMHLMAPLLLERNRFRHAVLDIVLTPPATHKRVWQSLAERTGGLYVAVKS